MKLTTPVDIKPSSIKLQPSDRLLFVGSCFAVGIGERFVENNFQAEVNPFGVMYNPVSVLHTLERMEDRLHSFNWVVITLGTNHIYREKATGRVVDNCEKRPQKLFQEEVMTVEECTESLKSIVNLIETQHANVIFTVSPIRYRKYGYHESQLSKATLLLAVSNVLGERVLYFPAYEIMLDELRDYRFYAPDMIHPSDQAVDYIFEIFREAFFSKDATYYYEEFQPIKKALNHKAFSPDSKEYYTFIETTKQSLMDFEKKWGRINDK